MKKDIEFEAQLYAYKIYKRDTDYTLLKAKNIFKKYYYIVEAYYRQLTKSIYYEANKQSVNAVIIKNYYTNSKRNVTRNITNTTKQNVINTMNQINDQRAKDSKANENEINNAELNFRTEQQYGDNQEDYEKARSNLNKALGTQRKIFWKSVERKINLISKIDISKHCEFKAQFEELVYQRAVNNTRLARAIRYENNFLYEKSKEIDELKSTYLETTGDLEYQIWVLDCEIDEWKERYSGN